MNASDENIDCVGMKRRIQDELRKKWGSTPWSERNQRVRAAAMADRHLARHARPRVDGGRTDENDY